MNQKKSAESSNKSGSGKKRQTRIVLGNKAILVFLTIAVIVTGITLIGLLYPVQPAADKSTSLEFSEKNQSEKNPRRQIDTSKESQDLLQDAGNYFEGQKRLYEQDIKKGFLTRVRRVDRALLQSLLLLNINPDTVKHKEIKLKRHANSSYYYQTLVLNLPEDLKEKFISGFSNYLHRRFKDARLQKVELEGDSYRVKINGVVTHLLILQSRPMQISEPEKKKPQIAIVIDDMGENISKARKLKKIFGGAISFSILPYSTYSRQIANLAVRNDISVLLHQPMEPLNYPEVDPGPGALMVEMDDSRIRNVFASNLNSIPGVIGVNNHMGSRFTANAQKMRVLMQELKERKLFFMDSLTCPKSKAQNLASRIGVEEINRDIFLDNEEDVEAILFQLQKVARLAKKSGSVVAIGHPYPETLNALQKWKKRQGDKFRLCSIEEIVDSEN